MVGQRGNGVVDTRAGTIDVDFEPERGRKARTKYTESHAGRNAAGATAREARLVAAGCAAEAERAREGNGLATRDG